MEKKRFKKVVLKEDIELRGHMVEEPQTWVLVAMCIPIVNIIMLLTYLFERKKEVYYEEV